METIQCTCTNATPVTSTIDPSVQANLNATAQAMNDAMAKLETPEEKVKKANNVLESFKNYIGSNKFTSDVQGLSAKYNIPPQKIASNFFEKVLGTVADIFGVALGTVKGVCDTIINLVGAVAHGIVNMIYNLASAIERVITLNKTAVASC